MKRGSGPSSRPGGPGGIRLEPKTLRDVADAAGVSIATVSNVVHGKAGLMSPRTRAHVQALIVELGYRPNVLARALRKSQRRNIGVLVIDDNPAFLTDPFITYVIAGLSNILSAEGHGALVLGCPEQRLTDSFLIKNDETDALAVLPSGSPEGRAEAYRLLARLKRSVVIFQDRPDRFRKHIDPENHGDVLFIRQDDEGSGSLMAQRLMARGARRIAFLKPRRVWPAMEGRLAGAVAALTQAGFDPPVEIECGDEGLADTVAAIARHVATHRLPDAIMAGNDRMGIGALRWVQKAGLSIPGDVRVTGFNAFEFREYSTPVLTSARSSAYRMGEIAATAILGRLEHGAFGQPDIVQPVDIVEGETD
jgi:LacI family transcriptional regulator